MPLEVVLLLVYALTPGEIYWQWRELENKYAIQRMTGILN